MEFFHTFIGPKTKLTTEATLCIELDTILVKLRLIEERDNIKGLLEGVWENIQTSAVKEPIVFSKYYKACCEYRKVRAS
jgi:hypothetical protein